jgi:hypothetical protein
VQLIPIPDESEKIPTYITAGRFYDGQRNRCCERRIYRVSSLLQDCKARLGGQMLACCYNSIGGKERFAAEGWFTEGGKIKVHNFPQ